MLVTGSEGLIGKELSGKLREKQIKVVGYDIKNGQNILDQKSLEKIICDVDGVIHLAAISRVVAGYNDPYAAVMTNVIGIADPVNNMQCGMRVRVCWQDQGEGQVSLPMFEPA